MSERKINWSGIGQAVTNVIGTPFRYMKKDDIFLLTLFGSLGTAVGGAASFKVYEKSIKERVKEENGTVLENFNVKGYSVLSSNTVLFEDSVKNISYDFEENIITIDGPDEADRVFTFEEYQNDKAIEQAKKIGCDISFAVPGALNEFFDTYGREYPDVADLKNQHNNFYATQCNPETSVGFNLTKQMRK